MNLRPVTNAPQKSTGAVGVSGSKPESRRASTDTFVPTARSEARGYDRTNLDPATRPQDDFYQYAVGGYLATHPIPDDKPTWGVDGELVQRTQEQLKGILEGLAGDPSVKPGSNEQKIRDFYKSGMDQAAIDAAGMQPIVPELDRIESIKNLDDLQDEVAHLHGQGIGAMFSFGADQDAKNPESVIGEAFQGGLGMPDRDYYLSDDESKQKIRGAYQDHVARMFQLAGSSPQAAQASAQTVMAVETKLAQAFTPKVDLRDPNKLYNIHDRSQLAVMSPNLSWDRYFANIGRPDLGKINVATPDYFTKLNDTLTQVPVQDWKTYLKWQVLDQTAPFLSTPFEKEDFDFSGKVLTGVEVQSPRWKRMVRNTDAYLGEALGQKYVQQNFPPEAKARALALVENIKAALRVKIQTGWMSEDTKKEALAKVDGLVSKIGYPDKWKDYSKLDIDDGVFANNIQRARKFDRDREIDSIGKPVDRSVWLMTPATVNAYYEALKNEIVFPAAILQPPYFDLKADDAANYGATGATIGHELTHGFDDEGSQFDARGNLRNWWQPQDLKNFTQRADGVAQQFDEFVFDGQKVNGKLVEGESIADLGGLEVAWSAYQLAKKDQPPAPTTDGFTPDQRFYLSYAMSWATNQRPEYGHLQVSTNEHPLAKFRVDGPLANLPPFQEAFGCKPGDPMVRPEEKRNKLWNS